MLKLYYLEEADSICSNRVLMTLAEKGIDDWISQKLVLLNRDQFKPEYLKLNPKAQVPTLVHDGKVIRESSIICDYLDDLTLDPALKPEDPVARAHLREWIKDAAESGYQVSSPLSMYHGVVEFQEPVVSCSAPDVGGCDCTVSAKYL